jgi:hypothetical protein
MLRKKFTPEVKNNNIKKHNYIDNDETCCNGKNLYKHENSILKEFWCHFPTAIISLCFSLLCAIIFISIFKAIKDDSYDICFSIFHVFHYNHILLAVMTGFFSFLKFFNKNYIISFLISMFNSILFCSLSDIVIPSLGSFFIGTPIKMHLCIFNIDDTINLLIFGLFGSIGAYALHKSEKESSEKFLNWVHIAHVWISSFSATFYIFSFVNISDHLEIGSFFILLTISVVFPCILSDTIIPIAISKYLQRYNNFCYKKNNSR